MERFRTIITVYVALVVLAVSGLFYTNHTQNVTEQKFCDIINTVVDAYDQNPPTSELGERLRMDYTKLQVELGCQS